MAAQKTKEGSPSRSSNSSTPLPKELATELASELASAGSCQPHHMRDTRNTSITHRDLAHDRCEKSSRGIWQCGPHSNRYAQGRVAVRFTLPLGIERTDAVRSGPSGSAAHGNRYVQGRVAVRFTLPLGIERADAVRSGSSGSATGTLRAEWQCASHCHSMVNVRGRYAQGRVAVRLTSTGTFKVEWQCRPRRPQTRKCYVDVRTRPE